MAFRGMRGTLGLGSQKNLNEKRAEIPGSASFLPIKEKNGLNRVSRTTKTKEPAEQISKMSSGQRTF